MKGIYLLVMELRDNTSIMIGKYGLIHFQKGCYVYVGSALNGLEQRIERHLRVEKKIHWHIDYFRNHIEFFDIFYKESIEKEECSIALIFSKKLTGIPDFGCSDCSCKSHLFYGNIKKILYIINNLRFESYLKKAKS